MTICGACKIAKAAEEIRWSSVHNTQKKKHQPHGFSVEPVLPPCTLRGSNPGHPVNISSYYMVLQSVIWCYPMPRIIWKPVGGLDLITWN